MAQKPQLEASRADAVDQQHPQPGQRQADHRTFAGHGVGPVLPVDGGPREGQARRGAWCCRDIAEVHQALARRGGDAALEDHGPRPARPTRRASEFLRRVETTPGRMLIGECLPIAHVDVPFDVVNQLLTKKDIGDVIDQVYRHTGQKDTVLFADRDHGARLPPRVQGRHLVRQGRHDHPGREG